VALFPRTLNRDRERWRRRRERASAHVPETCCLACIARQPCNRRPPSSAALALRHPDARSGTTRGDPAATRRTPRRLALARRALALNPSFDLTGRARARALAGEQLAAAR